VNKTGANATQLAECILLHSYSRTTTSFQLRENKQKLYNLSWHNSIFGYKFRTD